jgi:hypothetical protein
MVGSGATSSGLAPRTASGKTPNRALSNQADGDYRDRGRRGVRGEVSALAKLAEPQRKGNTSMDQSSPPLVKSKRRVADHGEVFTPAWLVKDMLDLVNAESERIESRVLEPACGSGNFLVPILTRKLATVQLRYGSSEFERRHYALLALMCIYGIERI